MSGYVYSLKWTETAEFGSFEDIAQITDPRTSVLEMPLRVKPNWLSEGVLVCHECIALRKHTQDLRNRERWVAGIPVGNSEDGTSIFSSFDSLYRSVYTSRCIIIKSKFTVPRFNPRILSLHVPRISNFKYYVIRIIYQISVKRIINWN